MVFGKKSEFYMLALSVKGGVVDNGFQMAIALFLGILWFHVFPIAVFKSDL